MCGPLLINLTYPSFRFFKKAIRFIAGLPYASHTAKEFLDRNILKLEQIRRYQLGVFMYRYNCNLLPLIYQDFFRPNLGIRHHPSRNPRSFLIPFARTNTRLSSIKCIGPRTWNAIPIEIRSLSSLHRAGLANVVALFSKTVGAQPHRITTKGHIKHVIFNESIFFYYYNSCLLSFCTISVGFIIIQSGVKDFNLKYTSFTV